MQRRQRCLQRLLHHQDASKREEELQDLKAMDDLYFFVHRGAAGDSESVDDATDDDEGMPLYGEHEGDVMDVTSSDEVTLLQHGSTAR